MKKLRTIFMGTPEFSLPALELLSVHPQIELHAVITMPDRPKGRGLELSPPPVAIFCKEKGINLFQTENINKEEEYLKKIESEKIELVIVLAFAQFLSERVLKIPSLGCFNIHTSLLPKYRGAAPIQYALLSGDKESGVSIQKMVKKMDAGDLVHSFKMPIGKYETGGQLYTRLKFQAANSLSSFIDELIAGTVAYTPQSEEAVSFAPELKKEDGCLNFKEESATAIFNRVRALSPWPGTYTFMNKKRVKIISVDFSSQTVSAGVIYTKLGQLLIGCKEGTLHLQTIQCEGKRQCSDTEFLNGCKETPVLE